MTTATSVSLDDSVIAAMRVSLSVTVSCVCSSIEGKQHDIDVNAANMQACICVDVCRCVKIMWYMPYGRCARGHVVASDCVA